ncbi:MULTISPECIES: MurR/RpiR family transcriptional regulator [unclassified Nocardioides]|jgi:DNA-binding MurR/RpiR family transcriptional regulator|uniref:MurR/RpiR family transcriptional regulator n=1 Tax=unclassified Nocardioides TaxID=2615069 RepID=UPI0007035D78|nr:MULTISPECIES: MurR/RpiR family transcriptional regulator [unclassified Nocardioides]KRC55027.1 RpiR family transcriptional regulator [Nocardioides sp. Root79]KRC72024.1 RpiR family transcriptional regulator [Nocardioides sp. Root240]
MRIDERIAAHHDELGPQERRAAATLLEHLDDLATYRAAELAELAGVSRATMSRLFRSLGFADFDQVREHLRGLRGAGEPRRVEGAPDVATLVAAEQAAIQRALEHPRLPEVAGLVALAHRVLVVGWRNSYPVALHLREQLAQARDDVGIAPVPGQAIGEELVGLGPDDVVVVVAFRRRPPHLGPFLEAARDTGAAVVLLGDPSAVAHAARATVWVECPLQSTLAFDSYAAPMALVGLLADSVLAACRRHGPARVRAITETYERLGEVE